MSARGATGSVEAVSSVFKETYSEKRGLSGCLLPLIVGALIGCLVGWFFVPEPEEGINMPIGTGFIIITIGGGLGLLLGGIVGWIIDRVMTKRERLEDEF